MENWQMVQEQAAHYEEAQTDDREAMIERTREVFPSEEIAAEADPDDQMAPEEPAEQLAQASAANDRESHGADEMDAPGQDADAEGHEQRLEFARDLMRQEDEIRRVHPEFDLAETAKASPAFRALIRAGERVEKALTYVHPEWVRQEAEQAMIARMKRRASRPVSIGSANVSRRVSVENMSEAELRRIDERLKRGEKVFL